MIASCDPAEADVTVLVDFLWYAVVDGELGAIRTRAVVTLIEQERTGRHVQRTDPRVNMNGSSRVSRAGRTCRSQY